MRLCGPATLVGGSGKQKAWRQRRQMTGLHMYDPVHPSATQSITHRQLLLSSFAFLCLLWLLPSLSFAPSLPRCPSFSILVVSFSSPSLPPLPCTFSFLRPRISQHLSFGESYRLSRQRQRKAFTLKRGLHLTAGAEVDLHTLAGGEGGVGTSHLQGSAVLLVPFGRTSIVKIRL